MAWSCVVAADVTPLPKASHSGRMTLDRALMERRSVRQYDPARSLSEGDLSDLLWAAAGVNRQEGLMRTNPTALNSQEIDLYVFTRDGVDLYDWRTHGLRRVAEGDHRALTAGSPQFSQDFVTDAPVVIVMVADLDRFKRKSDRNLLMAMADAGIVSQNINLHCASRGLATVTRATMDADAIRTLLGLGDNQMPVLNNPVGHPSR